MAFDKSNSTYSYGDYVFNDDMVTRYKQIRIVNNFLLNIEKTSVLSEDEKEEIGAEARFIRAMQYFGLVKRYGGVPLQTIPQEYTTGNTQALYQARDTEAATYDFIINECKAIYGSLPEVRNSDAKYRANRGAVLALWSRAALYAGTIAKYSKALTLTGKPFPKAMFIFRRQKRSVTLTNVIQLHQRFWMRWFLVYIACTSRQVRIRKSWHRTFIIFFLRQ